MDPAFVVEYKRDNLGRISSLTETSDGKSTLYEYHYDKAGRLHAVTDRVCPERRSNGTFLEILNGRGKGSSTENQRQIVGALLTEAAFNHSGIINAAVDDRIRFHAMIQDNCHVVTDVLLSKRPEAARSLG